MSDQPAAASPLLRIAAVGAGGFLGGLLRYLGLHLGPAEHYGLIALSEIRLLDLTDVRLLVINTVGVFIATRLLLGPMGQSHPDAPRRLFWTTGVLGGLTTYSSLIAEYGWSWHFAPAPTLVAGAIHLAAAGMAVSAALWWHRRGS